ncbi:MAG: hypothetical protein ACREV1_15860, partial [Gammaproteobacteria bacterium]
MTGFNDAVSGIFYLALTLKDGSGYLFDGHGGALDRLTDRYGNRLYFTRSGGRIQRITTQNGRYV